jgi:hypothetical protein
VKEWVGDLPASPKPIHCVVRSRVIDAIGPKGILKYKSRIVSMSVAYAEAAPELAITLCG